MMTSELVPCFVTTPVYQEVSVWVEDILIARTNRAEMIVINTYTAKIKTELAIPEKDIVSRYFVYNRLTRWDEVIGHVSDLHLHIHNPYTISINAVALRILAKDGSLHQKVIFSPNKVSFRLDPLRS